MSYLIQSLKVMFSFLLHIQKGKQVKHLKLNFTCAYFLKKTLAVIKNKKPFKCHVNSIFKNENCKKFGKTLNNQISTTLLAAISVKKKLYYAYLAVRHDAK